MSRRAGFSLIELLVVVVLLAIVGGAILMALMGQMQLSSTQNRAMINQQNLREALDYMTDEVSSLGGGVTEPFISTATTTEFQFVTDIDGDGQWNRIRYYLSGGNLRRQLWSSANAGTSWTEVSDDVLLANVSSLTFTYFQPGNTTTTVLNNITMVEAKVTQSVAADTTAFNSGRVATGRMAARATIRNRML
jgi:prepilin-type N-terminal cleavage/methylation domain-containing protein